MKKGRTSGPFLLDGRAVDCINSRLEGRAEPPAPVPLAKNRSLHSDGVKVQGIGFVLSDEEAKELLLSDNRNSAVIWRYVTGEDLNSLPHVNGARWVINFGDMSEGEARAFAEPFRIVEDRVKPYRDGLTRQVHEACFWKFWDRREGFFSRCSRLQRVIVMSKLSKYRAVTFGPVGHIYSEKVKVFASDDAALFGILQSQAHDLWSLGEGATTGETPAYSGTKCFDTFALPLERTFDSIRSPSAECYEWREAYRVAHALGLTDFYNRFHDPDERDPEIMKLRELHDTMDRAVLYAYGWSDIPTDCEFLLDYEIDEEEWGNKKKPWRYRWPDEVRDEVLARLLELNAERAKEEARAGAAAGGEKRGKRAPKRAPDEAEKGTLFLMNSTGRPSREIDGKGRTVRELLAGRKYSIDYYQREYKWQQKQVNELLDDLAAKFLESHEEGNERSAVADYSHYFLGSIIISDKDGQKFIIDGQQRLTTLTLLLIFLQHQLEDVEQKGQIADLIFSQKYGKRSFNLDIPERTACMEALYKGEEFVDADAPESVANILARYADLEDHFPEELHGTALPYFVDWLVENVHLVEITAYSDGDAYTIFETMNDRGLSLAPADMLKGYLLANIADTDKRTRASRVWKERVHALAELGKDEDADGIKSWLRSQYAENIRERRRGAAPQDFDLIGTEFHRWVRDHEDRLDLTAVAEFARFIERDFAFYGRWYERLRHAAETLTPGLECVHFNAQHNFTLQYPVLLAPLRVDDEEARALRKLRVVSTYIDILIHRRIWNSRAIDYSTVQYAMFLVMRDIRGKTAAELATALRERLDAEPETFASNDSFRLHGANGRQIHRLLARMTDYVETRSGQASRYAEYIQRGRKGYEIEHIWADHAERHVDEFAHPSEFQEYRNRIGGLLLLPKSFNASYGDLPYGEKREHYDSQNLFARSLHEQAYDHNPGFSRFIAESGLPFCAHREFKKTDLDARQKLYQQLAEQIWSPERLARESAS